MSPPTKVRLALLAILLLGALAALFALPPDWQGPAAGTVISRPYRLGLDLQGGTHLLYAADFSAFRGGSRAEAMEGLRGVIERRVNLFGVTEPLVQVQTRGADHRLIVELPGVKDIGAAVRLIGETPYLEFREVGSLPPATPAAGSGPAGPSLVPTELSGRHLKGAQLQFDPTTNAPRVGLEFNAEGERLFEAITERNVGKPLAIYLDGAPISAPIVREKISGGSAEITGEFSVREAKELVRRLQSGALPVPITLTSQQSVGASLGAESLARSLAAALAGVAAVAAFMLLWYRLPGLVAVLSLAIYAVLVLSLFKLIPVTLTAAGIAGFVLSVGMAVDANILIFERMREELRAGRALEAAVAEGFRRAWPSIRDSNATTIISSAILFWLGTSLVKGFALTLGLGVLVSMFSAITVSRTFLFALVTTRMERYRWLSVSGFGR